MMLLPALTQSTRRERHDYWRKWTRHADRETRYQAGLLTGKREIGSGPVIALGAGRVTYRQMRLEGM